MKAHHHNGTARINIHHGRSHTKKQLNDGQSRQQPSIKKSIRKKKRKGEIIHSKVIYTHYKHCEKPPRICETEQSAGIQTSRSAQIKKDSKHAFSKVSSFGGDLEGASPFGGGLEGALKGACLSGGPIL